MLRNHPLGERGSLDLVSFVLNVVWLVAGGALAALGWFVAGLIMIVTIVGLPFAPAAFGNGLYTLWPFGARAVASERFHGETLGNGPLGFLGNVLWFVFAGWWLALGHVLVAIGLAVTIIGLPFSWAHLKLASYALWPYGRAIVDSDLARRAY